MTHYFFAIQIAITTLVFGHCDRQAVAQSPAPPVHVRVTWTSDPSSSATVSWSTTVPGSSHQVEYRVRGNEPTEGIQMARSGRFTGGDFELYYHHVHLSELRPETEYEIQVDSDGASSPWYFFTTAPSTDRPLSILHGGDSRSDQRERRKMNEMIADLVQQSYRNDDKADDIFALAHGGDFIVSGPRVGLWNEWLSDHERTTGDDRRLLPIIPARGNHDHGKPFNEVFGFPDDDTNYYAINLSPQIRLVTLNSEISTAGDQAIWLQKTLQSSRPNYRWLIAQYHKPVYPAVKSPGSGQKSWVPLFEKYNLDLACESDGHNIKRTVPIRDGKPAGDGVVYIGEGGLGVSQRTPKPDRWFLQPPGMADKGSHVFLLTFTQDHLLGKCVLLNGEIRDRFSIKKAGDR